MNSRRLGLLPAVFVLLVLPLQSQVWSKKNYTDWSRTDCRDILRQSPWANEYMLARVAIDLITSSPALGGVPTAEGRDNAPHITYRAQIWSARPIRQAIVRLQLLDPRYEKSEPEQKRAFDEKCASFINAEFPDTVVFQLSYSTVPAYAGPLRRFWRTKSTEELMKMFYLNGRPGKIEPLQVIMQQGGSDAGAEFQIIFPRRHNNVPMADPELKQLGLEIDHPAIEGITPATRILIPFPIKRMKQGNEVIY